MENIQIRRLYFEKEEELEQLVELQNIVYKDKGKVFTKEGFRRWYLNNPYGELISFNAFDGEMLVAHYACVRNKMLIEGQIVDGVLDIATVTHPKYRGKGLFKTLASVTYEYARNNGIGFVVGVANANSFPGYMKYFPFQFVGQLDVKVGYGYGVSKGKDKIFSGYWSFEAFKWRCRDSYRKHENSIIGNYGKYCRTLLGSFPTDVIKSTKFPKAKISLKPMLYVGLGAKPKGIFVRVPKFIKHSPFNLIFMDLTNGKLPKMTKDNVLFQLYDFDVA